uniref:Protein kinase domain-containing protein n=1 Tax=Leersia perrieri TaxID=77586 RepID=A0A0D9UWI9_9ORYZ
MNTNTTSPFCEPMKCGNLTIGYPFWLTGTHPADCGYRAFQKQQIPPSWAPVSCVGNEVFNSYAWLAGKYKPDGSWGQLPGNCTVSTVLVMGYDVTAVDYKRLIKGRFLLEYTPDIGDCTTCSESGAQCRVNVISDGLVCQCSNGVSPGQDCRCCDAVSTSMGTICGSKKTGRRTILIVLTAAAAGLLLPFIYVLIWHRKGKKLRYLLCTKTSSTNEKNIEALIVSYGSIAPTRYKYSEVTNITSFLNNKLGEGGYGVVFEGRLQDGRLVAVKFLHDSKGNGEEFVNEVMSIGRTSHINIVSLCGFCLEGSKRVLLYEYMSNGSLDKYIYSENPKEILGWEKLYGIAIGIARGLEYLHHGCNTRIVHFDIKPQNILLDQDFCPKIADFGLAKLCRTKESKLSMTGARGTIGFIAPEVINRTFGIVSTKSDVYSYGMLLLEMVGGRKNVRQMVENSSAKYFPDWIHDHFALDDGFHACDVTSEDEQIAEKMTLIETIQFMR